MPDSSSNTPTTGQVKIIRDYKSGFVLQTVEPPGFREVRTYLPDGTVVVRTTGERSEAT